MPWRVAMTLDDVRRHWRSLGRWVARTSDSWDESRDARITRVALQLMRCSRGPPLPLPVIMSPHAQIEIDNF
jgi:hypothetical protein